jgi:hypothetical protein
VSEERAAVREKGAVESKREPKFWTCRRDEERLSADCVEDAMDEWVDHLFPDPLPETVTVYGFAPMELPSVEKLAGRAVDYLLELLDEEYGDPEGDPGEPTAKIKAAAEAFATILRAEYRAYTCEEVTSETVKVADYVDLADYAKNVEEHEARWKHRATPPAQPSVPEPAGRPSEPTGEGAEP